MEPSNVLEVNNLDILKYPRTAHLESSGLQKGDSKKAVVHYARLAGRHIVVEEKFDGGNAGLRYSTGAEQLLQCRGHYLTGGGRERQFNLFKRWSAAHESVLLERLDDRFLMFGEWMHKKHSVWYDSLPHLFLEFDIWDRSIEDFLDTPGRAEVLSGAPVLSVPVLFAGPAPKKLAELWAMVKPSLGRTSNWRTAFESTVEREGFDVAKAWAQTDRSHLAEGLYIKVEEGGRVVERLKLVRPDFVQAILDSDKHHAEQPFIPNLLADGVDLYAPTLTRTWDSVRPGAER